MKFLTQLITKIHFWRICCLLIADGLVFGATNPDDTPSFMLVVGFVLLCITIYYLVDGIIAIPKLYGLPIRHKRRLTRTITGLVSGLVALQSIGQLSPRDVLVLSLFTVLLYLYIIYSKSPGQHQSAE